MKVMGWDPASGKDHAAAWRRGSGWEIVACGQSNEDIRRVMWRAQSDGVTRVVLEEGYQGPHAQVSMDLAGARRQVEGMAEECGLEVVRVHPSRWHSVLAMGGQVPRRRPEIKARAVLVANAELRAAGDRRVLSAKEDDAAEAVCLAVWGAMTGTRERMGAGS